MQIYDKGDPLNPTDLRRRLEHVSKPQKELKSQEGKVGNDKQPSNKIAEEKLKRETSESILDPLTEKLEDIAEKLDKERIEAEAKWEKSQRELEEVKVFLRPDQMRVRQP